eukprot:6265-Heterococcus_DN1.PRE.2
MISDLLGPEEYVSCQQLQYKPGFEKIEYSMLTSPRVKLPLCANSASPGSLKPRWNSCSHSFMLQIFDQRGGGGLRNEPVELVKTRSRFGSTKLL